MRAKEQIGISVIIGGESLCYRDSGSIFAKFNTSLESAASVSSSAGQLLFYTDGRTVYNSTHAIMQNGNATLNGGINNAGLGI